MYLVLTEGTDAVSAWGSLGSIIVIYGLFFLAIWFFIFRPQSKERKRIAGMLANMEVGDCVLTTSGFYGIIIDISDDTVIVEFGNNKNCRIPMDKSAISKIEKAEE
ncbi:MAG: preprotein translocase subunit YajC [Lachnospiraceae bacterium]|nr:preprotein translocase subunit YajC [Lachnospiraceae bacterium]